MRHSSLRIQTRKHEALERRGVVYIEVLVALIPLLYAFFGICQLALLHTAQLVVQHAATRAARAAIVVLEDDPTQYDGSPAYGDLLGGTADTNAGVVAEASDSQGAGESFATQLNAAGAQHAQSSEVSSSPPDAGSGSQANEAPGGRWGAIMAAAYHPLSVLAPPVDALLSSSLKDELGSGAGASLLRIVSGRFGYNLGAASITLHSAESDEVRTSFGPHETVRVRVSFLMPCGVPMVSGLICTGRVSRLLSYLGLVEDDRAKELVEGTEYVKSPFVRDLILVAIPNLTLLTAEATMPNQGAEYYRRDDE